MATKDADIGTITLFPLLARVIGRYPKDFVQHDEEEGDVNGQK